MRRRKNLGKPFTRCGKIKRSSKRKRKKGWERGRMKAIGKCGLEKVFYYNT